MDIQQKIHETVTGNPVVLYMKGTPQAPQCGFSARAIQILQACGVKNLVAVDVLAVLHDLNLAARYAGRLLLMKQGRVFSDAAPAAVITTANLAEAFEVYAAVDVARCDGRPVVVIRPGTVAMDHGIPHG